MGKMLWRSLDKFNVQLHMKFHSLPLPRERDQVLMEIILDGAFSTAEIRSLSQCWGMLQCILADWRYLESFVFDPGPFKHSSNYCFPRECSTKMDWDKWFNFWHNYASTGGKLKVSLGRWTHPTHRKWLWYTSSIDDLHRIEDGTVYYYVPATVAHAQVWHTYLNGKSRTE